MCNPVLFAIPRNLYTLYHDFGAFRWYNKFKYDWAHSNILDRDNSYRTHYEYYPKTSEYITHLTPDLLCNF